MAPFDKENPATNNAVDIKRVATRNSGAAFASVRHWSIVDFTDFTDFTDFAIARPTSASSKRLFSSLAWFFVENSRYLDWRIGFGVRC